MPSTDKESNKPEYPTPEQNNRGQRSSFTINIQSWTTPVFSILLLVIGLLGGYYGRPLLESVPNPLASDENPFPDTVVAPTPTPDAEVAAQQQVLMELVVGATRHFRGDPDAPVTIIEFSDFL